MIFSRFFSPRHTSANSENRIKAISALTPDKVSERRILHELAFNDAVTEVSIAALEKLDSFPLWLKMSQISRDQKLCKAALNQVELALVNYQAHLSTQELKEYLLKVAPLEQIVKCFPSMQALHNETDFVLAILHKVGRKNFTLKILLSTPSAELRHQFVASSNDIDLLKKLQQKTLDKAFKEEVSQRIGRLKEQENKPVKLTKELRLVLSKMLVLLDKSDFDAVTTQHRQLTEQFTSLRESCDCLDSEVLAECESKFAGLDQRITGLLARLQPDWEAQQKAAAHLAAKKVAEDAVNTVKMQHNRIQGEQILAISLAEVSAFQSAVENAELALENLAEFEEASDQIESMLESFRRIWDQLPELQRQIVALNELLDTWQGELGSDNSELDLAQTRERWKQSIEGLIATPKYLEDRWRHIEQQLKKQQREQRALDQQAIKTCRKHINIISNLVEQGKYRGAMSRYKRLQSDYEGLSESSKKELGSRYEQTTEQIVHLQGWQAYIASPRRPQLIEQANDILVSNDTDMPKRAKSIKYLRQQWLSLGDVDDANNDELSKEFDTVLERAFEPCRAYYAQLEAELDDAANSRVQLTEKVIALLSSDTEFKIKFEEFESLKKAWLSAKKTDSKRYQALRNDWDKACTQFIEQLKPWWQKNRLDKEALIAQVLDLAKTDDLSAATQKAKQLQQHWKEIGNAGKRYESKLWLSFKKANDELFGKVKVAKAHYKSQVSVAVEESLKSVEEVNQLISNEQLQAAEEMLTSLTHEIVKIDDAKQRQSVEKALNQVRKRLSSKQQSHQKQLMLNAIQRVLNALFQGSSLAELDDSMTLLPRMWQQGKALQSQQAIDETLLSLEVLAQIESPADLATARSTIQLKLMQAKLNGESLPNPNKLIGDIIASDNAFFTRADVQQRLLLLLSTYSGSLED